MAKSQKFFKKKEKEKRKNPPLPTLIPILRIKNSERFENENKI
jgi:hypothetical protein